MRYAYIDKCEIVNGNGVGVSLYIQGCPIHCKGCFNPETWDFEGGKEFDFDAEWELLGYLKQEGISRLSILGGEPLAHSNIYELTMLISDVKLHYPNMEIWLWTGYTWEQIKDRIKECLRLWPELTLDYGLHAILRNTDYIITGPFIEEEKDLTLQWRGSRNQKVICCAESIVSDKEILYEAEV